MARAKKTPAASAAGAKAPVFKATFIGRDDQSSNVAQTGQASQLMFNDAGAIAPPLDPVTLCDLYEMSGALRTCIDAYVTNIDGFGHTLEPVLNITDDLEPGDEVFEQVREEMVAEKLDELEGDLTESLTDAPKTADKQPPKPKPGAAEKAFPPKGEKPPAGGKPPRELPPPRRGSAEEAEAEASEARQEIVSDEEVEARLDEIEQLMVRERRRVEAFIEHCGMDESFVTLRMKTRQDLEVTGNAYWEVLRTKAADEAALGPITQFVLVPSFSCRLLPPRDPVDVEITTHPTILSTKKETVRKRFRMFLQIGDGQKPVFFKEFGDPRVFSSASGKLYASAALLKKEEPDATPATEILHFKIHNSRSPYGVSRWISELVAVLGNRQAEEVNLMYFENRSVPPLAILVSGGRLAKSTVERLENYIKNEIKGKRNFHKTMILEAVAPTGSPLTGTSKMTVDIKPLTGAQLHDAQFLEYLERNTDMIGSVFRLPRLLRGDVRDFNRATAQTALEFTEQQVFSPLRAEFDFIINRMIFNALGIMFWKFKSKGADFSDPLERATALNETALAGYLTPKELRAEAAKVFGHEFEVIDEPWTQQPLQLTVAGIAGDIDVPPPLDPVDEMQMQADAAAAKFGAPGAAGKPPGAAGGKPGAKGPPGAKKPPGKAQPAEKAWKARRRRKLERSAGPAARLALQLLRTRDALVGKAFPAAFADTHASENAAEDDEE